MTKQERERYVVQRKGRWYYVPTKAMKQAGFRNESLGADLFEANQRAAGLNAEWDKIRGEEKPSQKIESGTISWLFDEFEKDPAWYGKLSYRTQESYDRMFRRLKPEYGDLRAKSLERRHCRFIYTSLFKAHGPHVAKDTMKCFRRVMRYAVEIGVRDDNPATELSIVEPEARETVWKPEEVDAVISAALTGGKAVSGNMIPPRPSVALATAIAYDIGQQKCDVLNLTWDQWDGVGFTVTQQKHRGQRRLYLPVTEETKKMIEVSDRKGTHVIIDEETGTPFVDPPDSTKRSRQTSFARIFKRFRERAGIERDVWFSDLRRTALTELGNSGATDSEIISISGHTRGSRILDVYVVPDKAAALQAAQKRWKKQ